MDNENESTLEHSENTTPEKTTPSIEIHAEIASRITFASHQNDVAVIADLAITNPTSEDLENLTLHISAEPRVISERSWPIDRLAAGSEIRVRDRRVSIAGGMLSELTERMRADIRIELRHSEEILAEAIHPIIALAQNEWGGARYMPELLAAFVTPNDSAVQRLLREASNLLQSAGRPSSLEGYQSKSRQRSWEIASGIWAAVVARGLTYAEPPASFEMEGQKIRLPSVIEEHGLATCLDTTLLFAAAIEQAGLHPIVVFTHTHALCGVWLQPQTLPALTVDEPMEIRKAIDQQELVLFETTLAVAGESLPFSKAIRAGREAVEEGRESDFVYAIDIALARSRQIQPLSSRQASTASSPDAAAGQANRTVPALDLPPELPGFDTEIAVVEAALTPEERLDRWKRSLLDLSKRNRLLNLQESRTSIPIFCPNSAKLEDKLAAGNRIRILMPPPQRTTEGEIDPMLYRLRTGEEHARRFAEEALERNEIIANTDAASLEKGLIELYRKAKVDFEEGGSNQYRPA